jgi:uncharacterized protein (UPF0548 family)
MFLVHRPTDLRVRQVLESQSNVGFSYVDVGSTRGTLPGGFAVDRHAVELGRGAAVFERAREAVRSWSMFDIGWLELSPPDTPLVPGSTVAVLAHTFGVWSAHICRVVYVIDEERRYGFAYGTLPEHAESGEELFSVEWRADGPVWYEILAFSRPRHPAAKLAYPVSRILQAKFRRDSGRAMKRAVASVPPDAAG